MPTPLAIEGATRAADHADREHEGWSETAYKRFCHHAASLGPGGRFTTEDVRIAAELDGMPSPPDRRAWGSVAIKAKRAGKIVHVGYAPAKTAHVHGTTVSVWTWAGVVQ